MNSVFFLPVTPYNIVHVFSETFFYLSRETRTFVFVRGLRDRCRRRPCLVSRITKISPRNGSVRCCTDEYMVIRSWEGNEKWYLSKVLDVRKHVLQSFKKTRWSVHLTRSQGQSLTQSLTSIVVFWEDEPTRAVHLFIQRSYLSVGCLCAVTTRPVAAFIRIRF